MAACAGGQPRPADKDGDIATEVQGTDRLVVERPRLEDLHGNTNKGPTTIVSAPSIITTTVLNAASNPVSPGSSSPPLEQNRAADFVPPTRPSSTPFSHPHHRNADTRYGTPADVAASPTPEEDSADVQSVTEPSRPSEKVNLDDFPPEIHEAILDHLFGDRVSPTSKSSVGMHSVARSWNTALRHSRRRELSRLALVSRTWKQLIQERLFRHIKLKATVDSLDQAMDFFVGHSHLRAYVKHLELWFPVFQPKYGPLALGSTLVLPTVTMDGLNNASYTLPANNCTLEEALLFVANALPSVFILTVEGGERKKAPMVIHSNWADSGDWALPVLPSVRTLVTKGQWNLMRTEENFKSVFASLPNLQEWHGSYSKPKSKSYISMAGVLPNMPPSLHTLHLCMEGDYKRETICPPFYAKVCEKLHFCCALAHGAADLSHFTYTGRVCRSFFTQLAALTDPRTTRLKSIDLTVKNCCRPGTGLADTGSGIQDMSFVGAFEALVVAACRSLSRLKSLEYLRIRFVDLESPIPPLNPYFTLRKNKCTGVWSPAILRELANSRPEAHFEELSESFGEVCYNKDGRMFFNPSVSVTRSRFKSIKIVNYAMLVPGFVTIH